MDCTDTNNKKCSLSAKELSVQNNGFYSWTVYKWWIKSRKPSLQNDRAVQKRGTTEVPLLCSTTDFMIWQKKKKIPVVSPLLPSHSLTKHREVPYDYFGSAGVDPDTWSLSGTVNFEFSSNIQVRGIQNFLPALVFKHVPSKWCESSHQCLKPTGTCRNWEKNNSFLFFFF